MKALLELYSRGVIGGLCAVKREPDGAWLPLMSILHNAPRPEKPRVARQVDRRVRGGLGLVERRKGRAFLYGQLGVFTALVLVFLAVL